MLMSHAFTQLVFSDSREVWRELGPPSLRRDDAQRRDPDEYEFFVLRTGNRLAQTLTLYNQLLTSIAYIELPNAPRSLRAKGVSRHAHLLYGLENFLIRTNSFYDRALQLVDAVFHLGHDARDCRQQTITRNVFVATTAIREHLRALHGVATRFAEIRNTIVHHSSFADDSLRNLEMYEVLFEEMQQGGEPITGVYRHLPRLTNDLAAEIRRQRTDEFRSFCAELETATSSLFGGLVDPYSRMKARLRHASGYGPSDSSLRQDAG